MAMTKANNKIAILLLIVVLTMFAVSLVSVHFLPQGMDNHGGTSLLGVFAPWEFQLENEWSTAVAEAAPTPGSRISGERAGTYKNTLSHFFVFVLLLQALYTMAAQWARVAVHTRTSASQEIIRWIKAGDGKKRRLPQPPVILQQFDF